MDLRISELLAMQRELQELHRGDWADVVPSTARDHLLWGVGEIGEVIDIIKKRGDGEKRAATSSRKWPTCRCTCSTYFFATASRRRNTAKSTPASTRAT